MSVNTNLNTNVFKKIENKEDSRFNGEEGKDPLAFKMSATSNRDMARFKLTISARMSDVNIPTIYFDLELEIEILECLTTSVSASQLFAPLTLYMGD